MFKQLEDHAGAALSLFLCTAVLALIAWLIIGGSFGSTYSRNFEAACAAAGGQMRNMGIGGDGCFKVTYEAIPMPNVRAK